MSALTDNYFTLFELPQRFALDMDALDAAYRAVQSRVHPDRFASASDAERRVAMQWAAQANAAYRTLRDPLQRATYLLSLQGIDVGAENNTAMAPDFLMQQMEWREAIDDAVAARNVDALDALARSLREDRRVRLAKLAEWLDSAAWQPAAEAVRQLMFIARAEEDVGHRIEMLENA
ncbi:Fe-S protein assembly co-chaperone HscB [Pandoraea nosoerga]|uniref:Co-chaperone protein HscB homolog n=1 Tax=Pandoraea nosoerga TaxID=2508296 RepID=A0A5E4TMX4_9BURK|nr:MULTISPECIES: Fe-S protein assembly co-chaperone HscB [Pandoraea]MBN4668005.1 Fe-S protein assembly co-chaperone HscB [Pandoraea nosoerga]MBN4675119.1 Fe-S protein assembly co-chaperone HscB [Pandoraea nosoerga]MBN4680436.1 Fe-S protein assembly co-chaperone HscB [Pandoraea nosoerga]MBN4745486.1 Fe-S protein assembly co-chaperone HscB [Pandoraea nosoerga]VVD89346.1 co-chaperone HscB [Pandoraea nosoerga]